LKATLKKNKIVRKLFFFAKDIKHLASDNFTSIRQMSIWTMSICWIRYLVLAKIFRKLKFYQESNESVGQETIQHNYKGLSLLSLKSFSGTRPRMLFKILDSIQSIDKKTAKILIVGPRAESEFFIAKSMGFRKNNITGLDLISYSPYVTLGDMHAMPFENSSFDVIVLGWVLAYSNDLQQACNEIMRVGKKGCTVITGIQYLPISIEEVTKRLGYNPGGDKRITTNDHLIEKFGDSRFEDFINS